MANPLQQMELMQQQQGTLAEIIRVEKERKQKLNDKSSIERLEELIKPITESLDFTAYNELSSREQLNRKYEQLRMMRCSSPSHSQAMNRPQNKFDLKRCGPTVACEEIFVTLLNILKRQEIRIKDLESLIALKN